MMAAIKFMFSLESSFLVNADEGGIEMLTVDDMGEEAASKEHPNLIIMDWWKIYWKEKKGFGLLIFSNYINE